MDEAPAPHDRLSDIGTCAWNCLFAGVALPVLFIAIHLTPVFTLEPFMNRLVLLFGAGVMLAGPGAFFLTKDLYLRLLANADPALNNRELARTVLRAGAGWGIVLAYLNLPAYACWYAFAADADGLGWLRMVALFAVAGGTCGWWIAGRVLDQLRPGMANNFALGTLLCIVLFWGAMLGFFLQARHEIKGLEQLPRRKGT